MKMSGFDIIESIVIMLLLAITLIKITTIEKELKDLEKLKMAVEIVESQINLLIPPPEFFRLPEVIQK